MVVFTAKSSRPPFGLVSLALQTDRRARIPQHPRLWRACWPSPTTSRFISPIKNLAAFLLKQSSLRRRRKQVRAEFRVGIADGLSLTAGDVVDYPCWRFLSAPILGAILPCSQFFRDGETSAKSVLPIRTDSRSAKIRQTAVNLHHGKFPHRLPAGENYEGGFVLMLEPEFFSRLHLNVLEAEGLLFNVLLFLRFCASDVKSLIRLFRRRAKHP